jgi:hypothetical protein
MEGLFEYGFINARDYGVSGSEFSCRAKAADGSCLFTLENIGDFKVGDEVLVRGAYIHTEAAVMFERKDSSPKNPRKWRHNRPIGDELELIGYSGSHGGRAVYFFDFYPESPDDFRWSCDYGLSWKSIPYSEGVFIDIEDGVRLKINSLPERIFGCTAVFVCSDRMSAIIEKVDGNTIQLSSSANRSGECIVSHSDTLALQRAIDAALEAKKSVFLPNGKYKLTKSLKISNATSFTFLGESAENTVIDNSLGLVGVERPEGSCFIIDEGREVSIKNLTMIGSGGFDTRESAGCIKTRGGSSVWGFYFKKSNATCVHNTERVYIENCHARKMSAECFYARGDSRKGTSVPRSYTRSIIYTRCSVTDCARNAFNNNDQAEGTAILNCRIENVGGCAWEGASRFVKIQGNYFRNCGSIALGNVRRRAEDLEVLGTGQHIISGNYFEESCPYSKTMIMVGSTATQVIIKDNAFVNFNHSAISVFGEGNTCDKPPENVIISSNSIDLTAVDGESRERTAIRLTAPFATVSDNHIYVRGKDSLVTGISVSDDLTRTVIHSNTLAGLGTGIESLPVVGSVGITDGHRVFYRAERPYGEYSTPALLRIRSHRYRGWRLRWESGEESVISDFDPISLAFTLKEEREMKEGDPFVLIQPGDRRSTFIHGNVIDGCDKPLALDSFIKEGAVIENNLITGA